jgi:hypothetical protein
VFVEEFDDVVELAEETAVPDRGAEEVLTE